MQAGLELDIYLPNTDAEFYTVGMCDTDGHSLGTMAVYETESPDNTYLSVPPKRIILRKVNVSGQGEILMCFDLESLLGQLGGQNDDILNRGLVFHESGSQAGAQTRVLFDDFLRIARQYYDYMETVDTHPEELSVHYLERQEDDSFTEQIGRMFAPGSSLLDLMLRDAITEYRIQNRQPYHGSTMLKKILNYPTTNMQVPHGRITNLRMILGHYRDLCFTDITREWDARGLRYIEEDHVEALKGLGI